MIEDRPFMPYSSARSEFARQSAFWQYPKVIIYHMKKGVSASGAADSINPLLNT